MRNLTLNKWEDLMIVGVADQKMFVTDLRKE